MSVASTPSAPRICLFRRGQEVTPAFVEAIASERRPPLTRARAAASSFARPDDASEARGRVAVENVQMAPRDPSWHHARAQRLLRDAGIALAGTEVTLFVVRVLHGLEAGLDDESNIDAAADAAADGPVGLVHGEPHLATIELDPRASTVADAARQAVRAFGRSVLDRQRRAPVVPREPPTADERDALRARFDAELPARIDRARAALSSSVWTERANAASFLGHHAVLDARDAIEVLLDDRYPEVARAAQQALELLPPGRG